MSAPKLFDDYKRNIHKLRLQLTDACNFRCFYCMPGDARFMPGPQILSAEEILFICENLVKNGIDEIRVSGGEPLLREDFDEIIRGLSKLSLRKLGLTTNGYRLAEKLDFLRSTQCRHINISLDSLDPAKFKIITKSSAFERVFNSIILSREKGFQVKTNTVIMRGVNDEEIFDFIEFSARYGLEVRFLELMKIGCAQVNHARHFIMTEEIIRRIERRYILTPLSVNIDSTALNFRTDHGATVGFISSESLPFCGFCSRLRLAADGCLRACLMSRAGASLRGARPEQYPRILNEVMRMKPTGRIEKIEQPMYQIGG